MNKNLKSGKIKFLEKTSLKLPDFVKPPSINKEVQSVAGTNVVRVPFGIRLSKKKRPEKKQNIATLILPISNFNSPTPPNVA